MHSAPVTGMLDIGRYPSGVDETSEGSPLRSRLRPFSRSRVRTSCAGSIASWSMNLGNGVQALCGPSDWNDDLERIPRCSRRRPRGLRGSGHQPGAGRGGPCPQDRPSQRPAGRRQERGGGSTWQSLQRGTGSVETDYLNGEIALLGRLHDIPTPANALVQRLTNEAARDHHPPGHMTHRELPAELQGMAWDPVGSSTIVRVAGVTTTPTLVRWWLLWKVCTHRLGGAG